MEKVTIDSQILEQMNRQINMAYWLAGIMLTLAVFVVGYQVYINTRTINKLKSENRKDIAQFTRKTFETSLRIQLITGVKDFSALENCLELYHEIKTPKKNKNTKKLEEMLEEIQFNFIRSELWDFIFKYDYTERDFVVKDKYKDKDALLKEVKDMVDAKDDRKKLEKILETVLEQKDIDNTPLSNLVDSIYRVNKLYKDYDL